MPEQPTISGKLDPTSSPPSSVSNGIEFLVDAEQFLPRLRQDLLGARSHVYVQTLSLEGDSAGRLLYDLLRQTTAPDRKVIVDDFSNWVLSDRYLFWPGALLNREIRQERQETLSLFRALKESGVGLKFVNPIRSPSFLARNHKKLIVVDEAIAYVGGLNFSEHNFSWHDVMVRICRPEFAQALKRDFLATWAGRPRAGTARFNGLTLDSLNRSANEVAFKALTDKIDKARERIVVMSPYLTFPIADSLVKARRRGVTVVLITPAVNNWPLVQRWITWQSARSGFDVRLYPGMSHLKAMLVDDDHLIVGSSNFDFLSYRCYHELIVTISDRLAIEAFKNQVLVPDYGRSSPFPGQPKRISGRLSDVRLRLVDRLVSWAP